MAKMCVLEEDKICNECGECSYCDLNPFKLCDNCGKCIDMDKEYLELPIDEFHFAGKKKRAKKEIEL